MKPPSQSASIRQLLVLAYLIITAPATLFVATISNAIDIRIKQSQQSPIDGNAFALSTNPRNTWLISIGELLRETKLPLSTSPSLDLQNHNNIKVAQSLSDVRATIIYMWVIIFIAGGCTVWMLGIRLNRPLVALNESISRLARDELVDPVEISGPRNIRVMANGLEKLRVRLRENNRQKTLFLRHISHEIKTPLTSIKEGSQLLDDEILGPINDDQREITQILNNSTRELQNSVENLLNYNSIVSAEKIRQRDMVDLAALTKQVLEKHALPIKNKDIEVKLSLPTIRAFVDQEQISTVFDNLVSNAVKFSPNSGKIKIGLKRSKTKIKFVISDSGPGVAEKHRKGIFDAFYIGDQSVVSSLKGTGLGLSIAKQYVDQHQGTLEILPTKTGATFQVMLNC